VALVVRNYDEAIAFFPPALGFRLIEDTDLGGGKRWVLVGPPDSKGTSLLLAQASTSEQTSRIGNQTAADVYLCFCTHRRFLARLSQGVKFIRKPRDETDGTVAVFEGLYGNLLDLIQRN